MPAQAGRGQGFKHHNCYAIIHSDIMKKKHICKPWKPSSRMLRMEDEASKRLLVSDEEFTKALNILEKHPKRVTFFGSARNVPAGEKYRHAAYEAAFKLAEKGYSIISGGGDGIMGASNHGAYDAKGQSIGFNIKLPHEQHLNGYTTDNLTFHYFFTRKVMMTFFSRAFVYFPGGFGTLDELLEIITMIQTKKMPPIRIVLFGHDFWDDFDHFIRHQLMADGYISPEDVDIYTITDDIEEVIHLIDCAKA